jgi:hypothetical protein
MESNKTGFFSFLFYALEMDDPLLKIVCGQVEVPSKAFGEDLLFSPINFCQESLSFIQKIVHKIMITFSFIHINCWHVV